MGQRKLKGQTASMVEFIFGGILIISGFGGFSRIFGASSVFNALTCLFLGLFLVSCAIEWRLLLKSYKRYSGLIGANATFSISQLAQATSSSTKEVRSNLELMIKKGLAEGYTIDDAEDAVVNQKAGGQSPSKAAPIGEPVIPAQKKTVACEGCGATNEIIEGMTAECEHCGTKLSA